MVPLWVWWWLQKSRGLIICVLAIGFAGLVAMVLDPGIKIAALFNGLDSQVVYHDVGVLRAEGRRVKGGMAWDYWFVANIDQKIEDTVDLEGVIQDGEIIKWQAVNCDGLDGLCAQLAVGEQGEEMVIHHVEFLRLSENNLLLNKASVIQGNNGQKGQVNYVNHYLQSDHASDTMADYVRVQRLRWLIGFAACCVLVLIAIYDNREKVFR